MLGPGFAEKLSADVGRGVVRRWMRTSFDVGAAASDGDDD